MYYIIIITTIIITIITITIQVQHCHGLTRFLLSTGQFTLYENIICIRRESDEAKARQVCTYSYGDYYIYTISLQVTRASVWRLRFLLVFFFVVVNYFSTYATFGFAINAEFLFLEDFLMQC